MAIPAGFGPSRVIEINHMQESHHTQSTRTVISDNGNVKLKKATTIALQDPLLAVALFIGSTLTALGHHLYYRSLNETSVDSEGQQVWAIRIGTGLAFLTRSGLAATLGIIAVQQSWATLRKRAMTIGGIDSMFGIMSNPWLFFNTDLLMHAKRLCALAAISWLLPLIAITTPATLSVYSHANQIESSLKVPFLNFSDTRGWATYEGWGSVSGVGPEISRLFTSVYTSNTFAPLTPTFPNASYDLEFWGPSYKCTSLEDFIEKNNTRTWSLSDYNYTSVEQAFYGQVGSWVSPGNSSLSGREYVYNAVSATPLNNTLFIGASGFNTLWNSTSHNTRLVCQLYNASYDITVGFDNGTPYIRENAVKNLELQDWDGIRGVRALGFANNGTCAPDPESNNATVCLTYYVFHSVFRDFLAGSIFINSVGDIAYDDGDAVHSIGSTPLFHSGLMDCPEIRNSTTLFSGAGTDTSVLNTFNRCRNETLASAIEDLSRNFTYSLMTYRNWEDVQTQVPVAVTSPVNFFSYNERYLLAAYLTAVLLTLVCITVGLAALMDNGFTGSTAFSAMLLTTRNPNLDRLAEDNYLGEKPLPKVVGKTRLQFGIIRSGETEPHAGFGLEGTVRPLGDIPKTKPNNGDY